MEIAFQNFKNVLRKCNRTNANTSINEGSRRFGNYHVDNGASAESIPGCRLTFGPFGSKFVSGTGSGSTSLPPYGLKKRNSRIYTFELGRSSSGSSYCSSGSNLTFGMEPKKYSLGTNGFAETDISLMKARSRGSDRSSSCFGYKRRLDWGSMVDKIFKEEIEKMTESFQRGNCFSAFCHSPTTTST